MLYYNGIFNLPEDVLRLVLQRLNVQSTIRLSQTSRYANALVTASTHNGPAILSNAKFPLVTTRFEFCNKTGLTLVALLKFHSGNEVCVLDVLSKLVDVKGWASLTGHIAQSTAARVATEQWDAARPTRATERRAQLDGWFFKTSKTGFASFEEWKGALARIQGIWQNQIGPIEPRNVPKWYFASPLADAFVGLDDQRVRVISSVIKEIRKVTKNIGMYLNYDLAIQTCFPRRGVPNTPAARRSKREMWDRCMAQEGVASYLMVEMTHDNYGEPLPRKINPVPKPFALKDLKMHADWLLDAKPSSYWSLARVEPRVFDRFDISLLEPKPFESTRGAISVNVYGTFSAFGSLPPTPPTPFKSALLERTSRTDFSSFLIGVLFYVVFRNTQVSF